MRGSPTIETVPFHCHQLVSGKIVGKRSVHGSGNDQWRQRGQELCSDCLGARQRSPTQLRSQPNPPPNARVPAPAALCSAITWYGVCTPFQWGSRESPLLHRSSGPRTSWGAIAAVRIRPTLACIGFTRLGLHGSRRSPYTGGQLQSSVLVPGGHTMPHT